MDTGLLENGGICKFASPAVRTQDTLYGILRDIFIGTVPRVKDLGVGLGHIHFGVALLFYRGRGLGQIFGLTFSKGRYRFPVKGRYRFPVKGRYS